MTRDEEYWMRHASSLPHESINWSRGSDEADIQVLHEQHQRSPLRRKANNISLLKSHEQGTCHPVTISNSASHDEKTFKSSLGGNRFLVCLFSGPAFAGTHPDGSAWGLRVDF